MFTVECVIVLILDDINSKKAFPLNWKWKGPAMRYLIRHARTPIHFRLLHAAECLE